MYEPFQPDFESNLPLLPGEIGPHVSTAVVRIEASRAPSSETVTMERIEFPTLVLEEPRATVSDDVAVEDLRTMILDRPEEPYTDWTKARLYRRAKELGLPGRSKLNKDQLRAALIEFEGR